MSKGARSNVEAKFEANAKHRVWLEALLDGDVTPNVDDGNGAASPAIRKLLGLQRAFNELHFADLDSPADLSLVQFKWDELSVLEQIHGGQDAELFRAFDPTLQREVALKLRRSEALSGLTAPGATAPGATAPGSTAPGSTAPWSTLNAADGHFIHAARRLATVRHPNVLAVHGAALHEGRAGMWMDLIQGETLAARIARDGPLSANAILQLATQLSSALRAVHAKAIVHGKIVPTNVIVEVENAGRFLLMDFAANAGSEKAGSEKVGSPASESPAADIQALGTLLYFAATAAPFTGNFSAIEQRSDLSQGLRALLRLILATSLAEAEARQTSCAEPAKRHARVKSLSAQQIMAQCQQLRDAPAAEQRARLRRAVVCVLVGALLVSSVALFLTLRARAAAEVQRNRVVAVRDFLLDVLRAPNPTQSAKPAQGLAQLFDYAIAAVPKTFSDDPHTEAQLLQQFGRSMVVFDQHLQARNALMRADQLFAQVGVLTSGPERVETRSYLSDVYRIMREFSAASALTDAQAQLCLASRPLLLEPRTCVAIINDHIEAVGYGGDPTAALKLVQVNLALEKSAGLEQDYESVFTTYLAGVMLRDVGRFADSRAAFIELAERTLVAVPAGHPGLLTDLMWLAWSANDLGEFKLAQTLNDAAWQGRAVLYPASSRYVVEVRMQAATLALHSGDAARAVVLARALIDELPNNVAFASFIEQALVLAALAGDTEISDAMLLNAEKTRAVALGEAAPKLAELRLSLAAVALLRAQHARAANLIAAATRTINGTIAGPNAAYLAPMLALLQGHLAEREVPANIVFATAARARAKQLLIAQSRCLFDPISATWVGKTADSNAASELRRISIEIFARRATLGVVTAGVVTAGVATAGAVPVGAVTRP